MNVNTGVWGVILWFSHRYAPVIADTSSLSLLIVKLISKLKFCHPVHVFIIHLHLVELIFRRDACNQPDY